VPHPSVTPKPWLKAKMGEIKDSLTKSGLKVLGTVPQVDLALPGNLDWPADFQMFSSAASSYCDHPAVGKISVQAFEPVVSSTSATVIRNFLYRRLTKRHFKPKIIYNPSSV